MEDETLFTGVNESFTQESDKGDSTEHISLNFERARDVIGSHTGGQDLSLGTLPRI